MNKMELSNPLATVVYKWILPIIFLLLFVILEITDWNSRLHLKDILFSENLGMCFIGLVILVFTFPLKRVWAEGDHLYISNLYKTIVVSRSNIEEVKESILSHPKMIKIKFKEKTAFGYKVKFIPIVGSFWTSSQRIIDQIK